MRTALCTGETGVASDIGVEVSEEVAMEAAAMEGDRCGALV